MWATKEKAITYLQEVAVDDCVSGYTQINREFGKLFSQRVRKYGGYDALVVEAGLKIRNTFKASDGHILSSYYEYLFDEYLYLNNIPHETEGFICLSSRRRYDFKIGDVYVEIWGISSAGSPHYRNYCQRRKEKEIIYKEHNLKLISIEGIEFRRSSNELQTYFKEKLAEHSITSYDKQTKYPIFNRRKIGYWNDATIKQELASVIKTLSKFPTSHELFNMKRFDLGTAIVNHGGYRKFATEMGFEPQTKEYSEEYVTKELRNIKNKLGHFPCDRELQELKRSNLAGMIKDHGGYGHFKELIEGHRDKKPFGYWNDEGNIIRELRTLIAKLGRFPLYEELGQVACGIDKSKKGINYFKKILNMSWT